MHRSIDITLPEHASTSLIAELSRQEHVVGLSVQRGGSIVPPGDIVRAHVLNRGADEVMRAVARARSGNVQVSVATSELASLTDDSHQHAIERDVDEAIWEEMETGLRHQGRITGNFLALMALGGVIATVGLLTTDPSRQAIAFVAAAVLAPGYEPVAKLALGIGLRKASVFWAGLLSSAAGYVALLVGAAAAYLLLRSSGAASVEELAGSSAVHKLAHPGLPELLVSGCAAVAGMVVLSAFRRSVIAGPLIAMVLIEAAALVGAGLAAGRLDLAWEGAERLSLDAILVVVSGTVVVLLKQALVHQRQPLR